MSTLNQPHRTADELLAEIDKMVFYHRDQEIIAKLMQTVSPQMFTKIVEEVIDGELYWTDFERILSNTPYPDELRDSLKKQKELEKYMQKLIQFRQKINPNWNYLTTPNAIAITENMFDTEGNKIYKDEYDKFRDNMIYNITRSKAGDSYLQLACKVRLYNALKNGELIVNTIDKNNFNYGSTVRINNKNYVIEKNKATSGSGNNIKIFEYLDPDDIFMFLNNYFVPILYKYQTLDEFDRMFMQKYNLSEDQMKQYKSLALILKQRGL